MLHERSSVEAKYLDHEIHDAPLGRDVAGGEDIASYIGYISQRFNDAVGLAAKMSDLVNDSAALEHAFGTLGQGGHPERLAQLAKCWNGVYGEFLDLAASLKGASTPFELRNLLKLAARCADEPAEKYRRFIDEYTAQVEVVPAAIAAGEPVRIEASLVLSAPTEIMQAYAAELHRLEDREGADAHVGQPGGPHGDSPADRGGARKTQHPPTPVPVPPSHLVRAVAFSPDGRLLVTADDYSTVRLWD